MDIIQSICNGLISIREKRPLVHSITNFVVMNETANATLCIGALPIMAHASEEVEEMVSMANALVLNIGTLAPDWVDAMELAGKRANEKGIPVILDPVGAGATKLRTDASKRLLDNVKVSIIRGNTAEIATLAGWSAEIRGVESISTDGMTAESLKQFASDIGCTVAATGPIDLVSDGKQCASIRNGDTMLSKVVGTGCMSNVIVGAFASVEPDPFIAAIGGLVCFEVAGEIAAHDNIDKPGTFHMELYNELYTLEPSDVCSLAKIDLV